MEQNLWECPSRSSPTFVFASEKQVPSVHSWNKVTERAKGRETKGSGDRYVSQSKGTWCKVRRQEDSSFAGRCTDAPRMMSLDLRPELGDASRATITAFSISSFFSPSFSSSSSSSSLLLSSFSIVLPRLIETSEIPRKLRTCQRVRARFLRLGFYLWLNSLDSFRLAYVFPSFV